MKKDLYIDGVHFLTAREAGDVLGYAPDYISRLCREGRLKGRRSGKSWIVEADSLIPFIKAHEARKTAWHADLSRELKAVGEPSVPIATDAESFVALPHIHVAPRQLHTLRRAQARMREEKKEMQRRATMLASGVVAATLFLFVATAQSGTFARIASMVRDTTPTSQVAASSLFSPIDSIARAAYRGVTALACNITGWCTEVQPPSVVYVRTPASPAPVATTSSITNNITNFIQTGTRAIASGVTEPLLDARLNALENYLTGRIELISYEGLRQSEDLADDLSSGIGGGGFDDIDITDSSWTGGTISGAAISGGSISGASLSLTDATLTNLVATDATTTNLNVTGSLTFGTSTGILQSTGGAVSALPNGTNGQVLKMVGGNLAWSTDISGGGGGGSGFFASTSDDLAVYLADPTDVLILGDSATTTVGTILEAAGSALFRGAIMSYGTATAPRFVATSSVASVFPYASTTALSATTLCLSTDCRSAWPTDGFSTTSSDYWKSVNNFFSTTSADYYSSLGLAFSTTSSNYWKSVNNFFSTTSADYYITQANLSSFSTTSADYWKSVRNFFSTTSADYYTSLGLAFSTTSADAWKNTRNFFSTTSADYYSSLGLAFSTTSNNYWKSVNNFFSTTSADYYSSLGLAFSTTSANYFVGSSTTIPKTYTANTFTALQTFGNASSTLFSAGYASTTNLFASTASTSNLTISALQNGLLKVNGSGVVSLAVVGTDYANFAYPFPSNATNTLLAFNGGLTTTNATATTLFASIASSTDLFSTRLGVGSATVTSATTSSFAITGASSALLATNANGSVNATTSLSSNYFSAIDKGFFFATTSADYWKIQNNFFSTTSADYYSSLGLAFSTTSADAWKNTRNFFSTTSADYYSSLGLAFSTTSNNYWKSVNNFFSTTSADYYSSLGLTFSTTSANYFVASSTTIPKTYTANVFTALQSFANASSTLFSAGYASTTNLFAAFSTTTAATTTNLAVSSVGSGFLLKTTTGGAVVAAVAGTDYANFAFPFSSGTNFGATTNSTTTNLSLFGGLNASSTVRFGNGGVSGFLFDSTTGNLGLGTTSPYAKLSVQATAGQLNPVFEVASSSNATKFLSVSGTGFGTTTLSGLTISGSATSTSNVGFNLTAGCYAINGTCLTSGGSLTGTQGQVAYFSGTNTAVGTSSLFIATSGNVGIGTTTPQTALSIVGSGNVMNGTFGLGSFAGAEGGQLVLGWNGAFPTSQANRTWNIDVGSDDALRFFSQNASGGTNVALSIASSTGNLLLAQASGSVGIGTTDPSAKLHISSGNLVLTRGTDQSRVLMHMDGTDASASFPDTGFARATWTATNNAQVDTAQSKFGGASMLLDGVNDLLIGSLAGAFRDDFTIDLWVRPNTLATTDAIIGDGGSSAVMLAVNASGNVTFTLGNISITCNAMITTGSWQHIAIVRSGSTATMYDDGTSCGSDATSLGTTTFATAYIGNNQTTTQDYDGWIDEFRVADYAAWTSNFTPPTSAYADGSALTSGYIGIGSTTPEFPISHDSGAYLSVGGSFTNASDRNLKTNFTALDPESILRGINALSLTRWNYKAENSSTMHIGPIAQEFFAQFGLNNSETAISTIDASGVSLVGIQALTARLDALASTTLSLSFLTSTTTSDIASTATSTATGTPETFAAQFFQNLIARMVEWFAYAENGITEIFAKTIRAENVYADTVNAKKLCLEDVCVTKEELQQLLNNAGTSGASGGDATPPPAEPEPTPVPEENASSTPLAAEDPSPPEETPPTPEESTELQEAPEESPTEIPSPTSETP